MARHSEISKFNITVNLPADENRSEYDLIVAKAAAKILCEILPSKKIDELIKLYNEQKKIN